MAHSASTTPPDGTLLGIERPNLIGVSTMYIYERRDDTWVSYRAVWHELDPDHLIWPHRILWQPSPP